MKKLFMVLLLCFPVGLLTMMGLFAGDNKLPTWIPDKSLLEQLSAPTKVEAYQLCIPKGYLPQESPTAPQEGMKINSWAGSLRDDGTRPYIMINRLMPPANQKDKYTLEQVFSKMLAGIQRRRTEWKQTPTETGIINGILFTRAYWTGTVKDSDIKMHGFLYMTKDGDSFIGISSQDTEQYYKIALSLSEAATMTFSKP